PRSIPASWPSAERSCLRRCLNASLTKRRKGSCASGAKAGTAWVRSATTAESTRGGGRKARAGTRRTMRGSAKDWTKTDRWPRTLGEGRGQDARPRPDLEHLVARPDLGRLDDRGEHRTIDEETLAQRGRGADTVTAERIAQPTRIRDIH